MRASDGAAGVSTPASGRAAGIGHQPDVAGVSLLGGALARGEPAIGFAPALAIHPEHFDLAGRAVFNGERRGVAVVAGAAHGFFRREQIHSAGRQIGRGNPVVRDRIAPGFPEGAEVDGPGPSGAVPVVPEGGWFSPPPGWPPCQAPWPAVRGRRRGTSLRTPDPP